MESTLKEFYKSTHQTFKEKTAKTSSSTKQTMIIMFQDPSLLICNREYFSAKFKVINTIQTSSYSNLYNPENIFISK